MCLCSQTFVTFIAKSIDKSTILFSFIFNTNNITAYIMKYCYVNNQGTIRGGNQGTVKNRKNPFGYWFWSHQSKLGKKKAIVAVSRKILSLIYFLISNNILYDNNIAMSKYQS